MSGPDVNNLNEYVSACRENPHRGIQVGETLYAGTPIHIDYNGIASRASDGDHIAGVAQKTVEVGEDRVAVLWIGGKCEFGEETEEVDGSIYKAGTMTLKAIVDTRTDEEIKEAVERRRRESEDFADSIHRKIVEDLLGEK